MPYTRRDFIIRTGLSLGSAAVIPSLVRSQPPKLSEENSLILLGTQGGPFIRSYKPGPSANLILFNKTPYIIDTGYGVTLKLLEAGVPLSLLKYIFITHHHSDHNLELGPLLYNSWLSGLTTPVHVYAPKGLNHLLKAYWKSNSFDIATRIKDEGRPDIRKLVVSHEFTEGMVFETEDVNLSSMKNIHPPVTESYAFKFKLGNKLVVFSGDTAYYPPLADFALDADYLIHEIMYKPALDDLVKRRPNAAKLKASILSHHTSAEDVGRIASQARAKNLVLNHFVPSDDRTITEEMWKEAVRSKFLGNIILGKDLLRLSL
jgi:ribonuclease BN (tRNA processing enzyme)